MAAADLAAVEVPTNTPESMQLAGMLVLCQSLVAAVDSRPTDVDAALDYADELARRTGHGTAYGLGFGPMNVGLWRMDAMLEIGDHEGVVTLAEGLSPETHPYKSRQSAYWSGYGRSLARLRGRHVDAVRALLRAEAVHPHRVLRNPFARDAIAGLLEHPPQGRVGEDLRGLAWRAGLDV